MTLSKSFFLLVSLLLFCFCGSAQRGDYKSDWKKVEEFEKKGLSRSALQQVIKIFDAATKDGNEAQQVKAAMYQMKYRNLVEEDNRVNNIFYLDTLIARSKAPAKNILQSMQAELFLSYRQNNRYKLYDRTKLVDEKSKDITTWSIDKLNATITSLLKASLKNEAVLKTTSLIGLDAIIVKGINTRHLRPTLYDFLAHRALSYFMSSENDITSPSYKFILNDEKIFAPANTFINAKFTTKDTGSLYYNAVLLLQDILSFHLNETNHDAFISADLVRLAFAYGHGVFTNKDKLYEEALKKIETAYANSPAATQARYLRAQMYFSRGQQYDPFTRKNVQFEIRKAKELCESAISKFPKSEGGINCKNLLNQIRQPFLNLETEKVNIPGQPFRSQVKYKNVATLYVRLIKTDREEIKKIEKEGYEKLWPAMTSLKPLKSWSVTLPDLQDFQQHSTEIKIDPLPIGTYFIMASIHPNFSLSENILTRQIVYVSNIGYIYNNRDELYVLDRNSGQPLVNATVQLWDKKYNYTQRSYEEIKTAKYTADKNGLVRISKTKERNNNVLQVKFNTDELFLEDGYYSYAYNSYERPSIKRSFLFTDRSIYRPRQSVFFKGIVVNTDSASKKSNVISNYKTTVFLYDVNQQKVGSINVQSNEYGSYSGSFILPEGILNGQFHITDSVNLSTLSFSVEEYKRPKFYVEISKPAGTYRINDSIKVKGTAKAYAGNNIDGAKVTYRVVRKVRYPIWWWGGYRKIWPPYGNTEAMEITNGETATNSNGEFFITFKAIPDETVDKKSQPVFYYEVSSDIADINGETRSGNTTIAVAYQALQLNIIAPDKMPSDSFKNIKISSTNMNGLFEKARVNLQVYKLQAPRRIFRPRYWNIPDQYVMSKDEYYASFPYDAYMDEDQVSKWPLGQKIIDNTDTTSASSTFNIPPSKPESGWYKVITVTKDKFGEEVRAEKYIQLINSSSTNPITEPIVINIENKNAEPGQKIPYSISTGFNTIWLIHTVSGPNKSGNITYKTISSTDPYEDQIAVTEDDRGGLTLNYVFIRHNRVYTGNEYFSIPWNNKDLDISYETFRDKTLPGSDEKWKIKITGNKGEKVAAETLISMYDGSLDQFKPHSWMSLKSLWPKFAPVITWTQNGFSYVSSEELNRINIPYFDYPKSYDELVNNGWNEGYYYRDGGIKGRVSGVEISMASPIQDQAMLSEIAVTRSTAGKESMNKVDLQQITDTAVINIEQQEPRDGPVQLRKNFNETAFFFPALQTDANGNIEFTFTIPEALTEWKMMTLAHSKDLSSGYSEKTVITQKPLMVQPNPPRFLREGDQIEFSGKIVNLSDKEITGTAQLELFDAATNKPVDGWFKNVFPVQYFSVAVGQSFAIKFPVGIPFSFNSAVVYRIKAVSKDGSFSDGEEAALPVLTNRMLVTETLPLNMRNTTSKNFRFDKLLTSANSGSLTNHALTVEYTSNPAWYAVQALPYLMEYPYECSEQNFNTYYANALASYISNSIPKIKSVFEKWKTKDTAALMSNLQKNEELKSVLLQETPWVLNALNESQQKKNIAMLFDMVRMAAEKDKILNKLKEMQSSNGGFMWFKGGPDDRYITQYILTGIGHLRKLNALSNEDYNKIKPIVDKALPYLDARIREDYETLLKHKANLKNNQLSYITIQYLYMRSFFPEYKINTQTAYTFYRNQARQYWLSQGKYVQGMIALALNRTGDGKTPKDIIRSLKENAIYKEEIGMYWKEFATGGYYWHQAPIESQAMMIEAFTDIDKNQTTIDDLKTWLLKQKQTRQWPTTKATAEACYALLLQGSNWLAEEKTVTINLGNMKISSRDINGQDMQAGTGYFKQTIQGPNVQQGMGNITVSVTPGQQGSTSTSWGAVYWQYFEDLDKISSAETPLKLTKKLFIEKNSDRGPVLKALNDGDELKIGDKVKVRIELMSDRNMEYIHMKDMRASCMEPVNVNSGYKYQGGLGYYESTRDASTNFFFGWLPRGTYVFEYRMFVTYEGNFSNGITTIQCMYAPEFTSHSEGIRINVTENK